MVFTVALILGLAFTAGALLLRGSAYVAGVTAFATTTFLLVWPAYHFFTWSTPWLVAAAWALVWAIRSRSTWSRVALILSAGFLTLVTLGAGWWTLLFTTIAVVVAFIERDRGTKPWKLLGAASVAVATLALAWSGNLVAPNIFGTAVAAEQPGDPHNLTVGPDDLPPSAVKCSTSTFNNNSLKPVGKDGRLWVDSVSTPFTATSTDAQFAELTSEICTNPTLGDAYAQALADAKVGDFRVADANPWLGDFLRKSNGKGGLLVWLNKSSDGKTIYVTGTSEGSYQYYAQMVNTLLYMLDNQGTKTTPSTANWPLGLVAGTLPRAHKTDVPEDKPYMALTYTRKSGDTCPYVLGVNLKDKRPLNVSCATATKVAPPTPTKPRPKVTPPPGKPTKPGHTPSPSTTPSPTHSTPPKSCPPGYYGTPPNCLKQKDSTPIPTNSYHTPGASPSGSAKPPVHPSKTATTGTAGSESTQTAEGSTPKPQQSETAPPVGNPTSTQSACVADPDSGKTC